MRKTALLLIICFTACYTVMAGDLERAFKYLNAGEYDKALQSVREELADEPTSAAANYAMARLCSSRDYRKYNLDSATIYINKAMAATPLKPDDKQTKKFLKLGVRDFTIKSLYDEINKLAFEKATLGNSFESYDHFLIYSHDETLNATATDKRDEIKYEELKITENIDVLKDFLNNYPKSKKYDEANRLYEKLLYEKTTKPNTHESYKEYLDKYPTGPYVKEAQAKYDKKLYESYIKKNTLGDYLDFEKNYPKSPYLAAVQDSIYSFSTKGQAAADYDAFIKGYPRNKNVMEAWGKLYDIYTANAVDSDYEVFERLYPNSPLKDRLTQDKYLAHLSLSPFKTNEKYGYVNTATQTMILAAQYAEASDFSDGLAAVAIEPCTDSCLYSYIDKSGRVVIDKHYTSAGDFDHGRAVVATSYCEGSPCLYGIIDRKGEYVLKPQYEEILPASEGLYATKKSIGYGFINEQGKVVVPFMYNDAIPFSEGLAAVQRGAEWIYIDKQGNQVFDKAFDNVSPYSSGLAAVTANDSTYGYIDKVGSWAIQPAFDFADPFIGDTAIVTIRDKNKKSKDYGLSFRYKIDKSGKTCYKLINPNAVLPHTKNTGSKRRKRTK